MVISHPLKLIEVVGLDLGTTDWMLMEQERINQFADATDDQQWIHVDPERSAIGPFGQCIAHGFLTLSLASKFLMDLLEVKQISMAVNYGCEKVRFPNTISVGQKIRGHGEVISAEQKPGAVQAVIRITIEVEGEERPACVADTIARFYYAED